MISIHDERLIRLADVPKLIPSNRDGKKIHISTVFRWCRPGLRGIRLECVKIGGASFTSHEAVERFVAKLSTPIEASTDNPDEATARSAAAEAKLEEIGI